MLVMFVAVGVGTAIGIREVPFFLPTIALHPLVGVGTRIAGSTTLVFVFVPLVGLQEVDEFKAQECK